MPYRPFFTHVHVVGYTYTLPWYESYQLLNYLNESKWKISNSEQWNFAVDYTGKNRITNVGILTKPKIGSGLLYSNRDLLGLVQLLDHHKWKVSS